MRIPTKLDGAKVILYTSNSLTNQYGTIGIINDDKEIIDEILVTAMAICQYEGSNIYYLFSCDLNWEVIGDIDYDTIDEAKESASLNRNVKNKDWKTI
ncbi:hypothetical protein AB1282_20085 [Gottfriedia sp. S16(2024)]|uniref:hypothetical protein n=1 Tax=Gottfriedia sp. S16(2024) TaxID=3162883 RepID=UPI003D20B047